MSVIYLILLAGILTGDAVGAADNAAIHEKLPRKSPALSPPAGPDINKKRMLENSYLSRLNDEIDASAGERRGKADVVMETLGIKEGDAAAVVGTRPGFFAFRIAEKAGKAGRVYAVDNDKEILDLIIEKMHANDVKNIIPVQSSNVDPGLPSSCCNVILMDHAYRQLFQPVDFMRNLKSALKPGGRIAIIGRGKTREQGVKTQGSTQMDAVAIQMGYAGYAFVKQYDVLPQQYFSVFEIDPAYSPDSIIYDQKILEKSYLSTMIEDEESPRRDAWQKPEMVIAALGVREGDAVADVGSGTGYFTFRLARKVGKTGMVYAVDNKQEFLDYITSKMQKDEVRNILPLRSSNSEPKLPLSGCDAVLMVNTYGSLYKPVEFMRNLRKALKPGGRVAIIGYNPGRVKSPFNVSKNEVVIQMESAGYQLIKKLDFLGWQYYLVFQ